MGGKNDPADDQTDCKHGRDLSDRHEGSAARYRAKPLCDPGQEFRRGSGYRIERLVDVAAQRIFRVHAWASVIGKSARSSRMPR